MANPLTAVRDFLRGADLQTPLLDAQGSTGAARPGALPVEKKLYYYSDVGAAIRLGALVHGPGASELLGAATGHGQDANSAVFACLTAICTAYIEARPRVYRVPADGGDTEVVPDHPLEQLLDRPNPAMAGAELWWWTQWAKHVHGNAYWLKLRAQDATAGNVVELWPVSPVYIAPVTTPADRRRGVFISSYKWEYETGKYRDVPVENVVHFRYGLDDYDHRLGIAPLRRLVRQMQTDDAASRFTAALLANFAVPGMVVSFAGQLDEAEADEVKRKLSTKFGSGQQGNVAVLTEGMTAEQFGFSPEQLDMKALQRLPEERIAAVLRVPAIIAGLGAGLDRSTYANFREAREMFTEQTILPLYSMDAATLNRQLLPDFASDRRLRVEWDTDDLRALQEDADRLWARTVAAAKEQVITKNEARAILGQPPVEGGDDFAAPPAPAPALPAGSADGQAADELAQRRGQRQGQGQGQGQGQAATRGAAVAERKAVRIDPADFPELLAAIRELAEPALVEDMRAYFDGQRERVQRRLLADVLDSGTADPATARAALPRP